MRSYLDGKPMDEIAMERLRCFEARALEMHPNGYWLAFSGGKDSCVILDLAKRAGVKFEAHHNLTTADPPELVQFVKTFPDVEIHKAPISMWALIRKKGLPPRQNMRYCCEVLKERSGSGCMVITGVRWGESVRRSKRKMAEACFRDKRKFYLHPIIDWSTSAVWEYIRERDLPYCRLYDEGWKRIGCVLCPMSSNIEREKARWPRIAAAWERAIAAAFYISKPDFVATPEEYIAWWYDRRASSKRDKTTPLFGDDMADEPADTPLFAGGMDAPEPAATPLFPDTVGETT